MFEEHFDVLKPGAKKPKKNNLVAPTGHAKSALLARFYLLLQAYAKLRVKGYRVHIVPPTFSRLMDCSALEETEAIADSITAWREGEDVGSFATKAGIFPILPCGPALAPRP